MAAQSETHAQFSSGKVVDHYRLGKTLGSGSFAFVTLATHRTEKNRWAANLVDRKALIEEDRKGLEQEIQIMFNMHHPNIVNLKECYCSDTHICLVQGPW